MYCWLLTENDNKMWWECCDRDALSQVPENSAMSAGLESVLQRQSTGCRSLHIRGLLLPSLALFCLIVSITKVVTETVRRQEIEASCL